MNIVSLALKSLVLTLMMSFAAYAADSVDINRADSAELARTLTGVGPAKADAIVAWRETNGPFESADQLAKVKGIGPATVEKNRDRIEVERSAKTE